MLEYAWSAGFFDGEGTTSTLKTARDRYTYARISIAQKDVNVLEKFRDIMEVGKIYKSKTRDIYNYNIYKRDDVENCLNKMWPFLSEIKKIQAIKVFDCVDKTR